MEIIEQIDGIANGVNNTLNTKDIQEALSKQFIELFKVLDFTNLSPDNLVHLCEIFRKSLKLDMYDNDNLNIFINFAQQVFYYIEDDNNKMSFLSGLSKLLNGYSFYNQGGVIEYERTRGR